jgi:hypothetical protein
MSSPNPPAEVARNIVVMFLVGIALVVGLVVLVYMLMVILDQFCGGVLEPGGVHEVDRGPVARKAGLWGLLQDERRVILERILIGKPYTPEMLEPQNGDPDVENQPPKDDEFLAYDKETQADEAKDEIPPEQKGNDETLFVNMVELDDAQHHNTCAICLSDFVPGEMVVTGTSCTHIFHKPCAFEWLEKQDHCPYCRKEMMTPSEMKSTAEEVLGEQRVVQMRIWGPPIKVARNG